MWTFLAALHTIGHLEGALGLCNGDPLPPSSPCQRAAGENSAATFKVCFGAKTSITTIPTLTDTVMSPAQPCPSNSLWTYLLQLYTISISHSNSTCMYICVTYCRWTCSGRGVDHMIFQGPFQPLAFCDSVCDFSLLEDTWDQPDPNLV